MRRRPQDRLVDVRGEWPAAGLGAPPPGPGCVEMAVVFLVSVAIVVIVLAGILFVLRGGA